MSAASDSMPAKRSVAKKERNATDKSVDKDAVLCPEGRISTPVFRKDKRAIVDVDKYIPYFLSSVNNALSRGASHYYLKNFGIGIVEWRVVSMLAIEPRIPASRACEVVALDKAQTSRSLKRLLELGYVEFNAAVSDPRKKVWWLNKKGYELHDRVLEAALKRERELIRGAEPEDLEAFLRVIRIMRKNVDTINNN